MLLSSALAGVLVLSAPSGIPISPAVVQVLLPVARVLADLVGIVIVGCLLLAAVVLPSTAGALDGTSTHLVRVGSRLALLWLLTTAVAAMLTLADVLGLPVSAVVDTRTVISFLTESVVGHAFLAQMAGIALIAVVGPITQRRWQALVLLGLAAAALAARSTSGHAGTDGSHEAATLLLAAHIIAIGMWVGGLAAIGLLLLKERRISPRVATRFSAVALWCVTVVAVTGVSQVLLRIPEPIDLFTTAYGLLLVAKAILLSALIALGWLQRSSSLPAMERGAQRPFAVMVLIEVVLMAIALGLSVTLSRTPTVSRGQGVGADWHVHGLPGPPASAWDALAQWRVDGVMVLAGLALVVAYALWRSRVLASGGAWGSRLVAVFACGLAVLLLASCTGLGTYSPYLASALLIHCALLLLVAPTLVLFGIPARELAAQRWVPTSQPLIPVLVTLSLLTALFATPALGYALWNFWGRTLLDLMLLALGLWAGGSIIRSAREGGPRGRLPLFTLAGGLAALVLAGLLVPGILVPAYFVYFVPPFTANLVRDELIGLLGALVIVAAWLAAVLWSTSRSGSCRSEST